VNSGDELFVHNQPSLTMQCVNKKISQPKNTPKLMLGGSLGAIKGGYRYYTSLYADV
jgi:hypothetical protein